jgi:Xaa-Pro aminopeptidase
MVENDNVVPEAELEQRRTAIQAHLQELGLDGALIVQKADLYYFAGTIQNAQLYIPNQGQPLLMVYKSLERAQGQSALDRIVQLSTPRKIPHLLAEHGYPEPKRLGLELDVLPTQRYFQYQHIFEGVELSDVSHQVRLVRAVKSDYELELMRTAAHLSDRMAASVPELLRPGMTELELAGKVEALARAWGHQGIVRMRLWGNELFYGHLMCGPDAAVPSYLASPTGGAGPSAAMAQGAGMRVIEPHQPILLDYVFVHQGYISDHTRIFSLGALPSELLRAHEVMLQIQDNIGAQVKPGIAAGEIYDLAVSMAENAGYGGFFMGAAEPRIKFVGHGVGLELDEYPFLAKGQTMPLAEGMTIALEPKLVFPGKGVVGIENTHAVIPDGLQPLGSFPDEICIIND